MKQRIQLLIQILMWKLDKKINSVLITIVLIFTSCNTPHIKSHQTTVVNFDWLIGKWMNNKDTTALFFENWTKSSATNYSGISYIISNSDNVFFESMQLLNSDTGTYYSVAVRNQNNAETVNFKLVSTTHQTYSFEQPKHDFPNRINYQYKAPDTLNACIEGVVKGEKMKTAFLMWRKH